MPPLLAAVVAALVRPYRPWVGWVSVLAAGVSLVVSVAAAVAVATAVPTLEPEAGRIDALSALLAVCISFVMLLASALGPGLADERAHPSARPFRTFIHAFSVPLLAAVPVQHLALPSVAIAPPTIPS